MMELLMDLWSVFWIFIFMHDDLFVSGCWGRRGNKMMDDGYEVRGIFFWNGCGGGGVLDIKVAIRYGMTSFGFELKKRSNVVVSCLSGK
jgi:hypothetical protein